MAIPANSSTAVAINAKPAMRVLIFDASIDSLIFDRFSVENSRKLKLGGPPRAIFYFSVTSKVMDTPLLFS